MSRGEGLLCAGVVVASMVVPGSAEAAVHSVTAERLGPSWQPDCPVAPEELRLIAMPFVGFDGAAHPGELIVAADEVDGVIAAFNALYDNAFPIERMITIEKYDADDDKSMADNNTSAFNCRRKTGGDEWSHHAYGHAVDINPVRNPYISESGEIAPPNGEPYADRTRTDPGMIHADDPTVAAFADQSWSWGGAWPGPIDYQHFENP